MIDQILTLARQQLTLPESITILLVDLPMNVHGGIMENKKIAINKHLTNDDLINALLHELIHLDQIHTKRLKIVSCNIRWDNQPITVQRPETMFFADYIDLPWEVDVRLRLPSLFAQIKQCLPPNS